MKTEVKKLSSGKVVAITTYPDGSAEEIHRYGDDIAILYRLEFGKYVSESYFDADGYIGKRRYSELIRSYPDMPDAGLAPQQEVEIKKAQQNEHKAWKKKLLRHVADKKTGNESDSICQAILRGVSCKKYIEGEMGGIVLLGELNARRSDAILNKLISANAREIFLCKSEIIEPDNRKILAGGLVLELSGNDDERRNLFVLIDKIVREFGYDGPMDDGQRYAYLSFS